MAAGKRRCTWVVLGACGLLMGCGGATNPFSNASDTDMTFINASQTWDLDKNGTVTCEEWKQYATSSHRQADSNGDGMLSGEEWAAMERSDRLFSTADLAYYDANSDGKASLDEIVNRPNSAFAILDKNKDCQIGHAEKVTVHSIVKPKSKDFVDPSDPSGRGQGGR